MALLFIDSNINLPLCKMSICIHLYWPFHQLNTHSGRSCIPGLPARKANDLVGCDLLSYWLDSTFCVFFCPSEETIERIPCWMQQMCGRYTLNTKNITMVNTYPVRDFPTTVCIYSGLFNSTPLFVRFTFCLLLIYINKPTTFHKKADCIWIFVF